MPPGDALAESLDGPGLLFQRRLGIDSLLSLDHALVGTRDGIDGRRFLGVPLEEAVALLDQTVDPL